MWPEAIVAALGGLGASAAYVAHKARNYNGGWSGSEIDRVNRRRNTTTPPWDDPEFNRREPAPEAFRPPAPPPAFYGQLGGSPPIDWANHYKEQDKRPRRFNDDGTWRESPKDTEPPSYDGPTGS